MSTQEQRRANYLKNREAIKARVRAYAAAHREGVLERKALYRLKNRRLLAADELARYYSRREEVKAKRALYRLKNREHTRQSSRQHSLFLSDRYCREQLSKNSRKSMHEWTKEDVDAKRASIIAFRKNREAKQAANIRRNQLRQDSDAMLRQFACGPRPKHSTPEYYRWHYARRKFKISVAA